MTENDSTVNVESDSEKITKEINIVLKLKLKLKATK